MTDNNTTVAERRRTSQAQLRTAVAETLPGWAATARPRTTGDTADPARRGRGVDLHRHTERIESADPARRGRGGRLRPWRPARTTGVRLLWLRFRR